MNPWLFWFRHLLKSIRQRDRSGGMKPLQRRASYRKRKGHCSPLNECRSRSGQSDPIERAMHSPGVSVTLYRAVRSEPGAWAQAGEKNSPEMPPPRLDRGHHACFRRVRARLHFPSGGYHFLMSDPHIHATHPDIVKRLKRASGHLQSVIAMIEDDRPCTDIAQQLHAVEKAILQAKRTLIQDHIDHCLDEAVAGLSDASGVADFKAITRYL